MTEARASWTCPVCGGSTWEDRFRRGTKLEAGPEADAFRPSAELFGHTSGRVVRCLTCGHGSVGEQPTEESVMTAYEDAADTVSLREEDGQVETARRALVRLEQQVGVGRAVDLGCWTGSFLVAAKERGWETIGIEPSTWAAERARARGIEVLTRDLFDHGLEDGAYDLVVLCDVLEHLIQPRSGLEVIARLLRPGGVVYITVPNAGSVLARLLGSRWWSVLPMHLQYFTPHSIEIALNRSGFDVIDMRTHAKAFSARYYAERLGGYSGALGRAAVWLTERTGLAGRMVAPDFRDRLAVTARRLPPTSPTPPAPPPRRPRRARSSS